VRERDTCVSIVLNPRLATPMSSGARLHQLVSVLEGEEVGCENKVVDSSDGHDVPDSLWVSVVSRDATGRLGVRP